VSDLDGKKTARLLELLKKEHEVFTGILELAKQQAELIEADDIDAFSESLNRTQEKIEIINELHKESSELMQTYTSHSGFPGEGKNSEIEITSGKLRKIIEECAGLNDKNSIAAKKRTQYYMERIDKLHLSRKSIGSYIQNVAYGPEMIDKKM